MGEQTWNLVGTGLVTLVVGVMLFWLQQGGRRARLRRQIHAELELIALLGDERVAITQRLNRRVNRLLLRYEPDIPAEQQIERRAGRYAVGISVVTFAVTVVVFRPEQLSTWQQVVLGVLIAVFANVVAYVLERIWRRHEARLPPSVTAPGPSVERPTQGPNGHGPDETYTERPATR